MEFFKSHSQIPFMKQRRWAAAFSIIIFIASLISLAVFHLNLGLDFTGGTKAVITFTHPVQVEQIRKNLTAEGIKQAEVQAYGAEGVSIRLAPQKGLTQDQLLERLAKATPGGTRPEMQYIGPEVGSELATNGILAILVALIATVIYIAVRFDFRFAMSAAVALVHTPVLILGIFSLFQINFDLITLAAVLTVIGYSLNDTIVVYDRVRENFRKVRRASVTEIIDLSINQTLSRTIMTSGLTLLVVIALYIFGGERLEPFALALIIGIVIGTYSSIYVAGSLAVTFGLKREHLVSRKKTEQDDMP
jgi:preprotein translocase subunit SecF